jgi:signal transduction histidine kinase
MLLERLQANPLRALIWIEAVAFGLSFAADLVVGFTGAITTAIPLRPHLLHYALVVALTAVALFAIPHEPNRRYPVIFLASLGVAASGMIPSPGSTSFILLMILASRLTFAFGFAGAAIALIVSTAAIAANGIADAYYGAGRFSKIDAPQLFIIGSMFSIQNALIMAIIGMMWVYARKAASNAAVSERMRIALDLHDSLGHGLTTLAVQLQNAD